MVRLSEEKGCYKMMLSTGSHVQRTHDFYKSCGYSAEGKTSYVNMLKEVKFKY